MSNVFLNIGLNSYNIFQNDTLNHERKYDLWLPKFSLETTQSLEDILKKIGITDVFVQGKADLTAISPDAQGQLALTSALQKVQDALLPQNFNDIPGHTFEKITCRIIHN